MKLAYKGTNYAVVETRYLNIECPGIRQSYLGDASSLLNNFDDYDKANGVHSAAPAFGYVFVPIGQYPTHPLFIVKLTDLPKYYVYQENEFGTEVP